MVSDGKQKSGPNQVRPALKATQRSMGWSQESPGSFFLGSAHGICSDLDSLSYPVL